MASNKLKHKCKKCNKKISKMYFESTGLCTSCDPVAKANQLKNIHRDYKGTYEIACDEASRWNAPSIGYLRGRGHKY